jgi:acetyl-CoA carboxylase biotin carboxylase subunit
MRVAHNDMALRTGIRNAMAEAAAAFGDPTVYIEKFLEKARHIEVQILGDQHGNVVHLFERDCSMQRRHQKLIEESPCPVLDDKGREKICQAAVRLGKAAGYYSAGTVEFLMDEQRNFYLLEVNTRLQVEHPVTELVTGLDLVREQILIAAGEKLRYRQQDIQFRGSAIECRIYAEDPDNNFFPSPGRITVLEQPQGPGVRVDSGAYAGWTVPLEYDSLIAKLAAWGQTRGEAIDRLLGALREYHVGGIKTTIPFFCDIIMDSEFQRGDIDTGFIQRGFARRASEKAAGASSEEEEAVAVLAAGLHFMTDTSG